MSGSLKQLQNLYSKLLYVMSPFLWKSYKGYQTTSFCGERGYFISRKTRNKRCESIMCTMIVNKKSMSRIVISITIFTPDFWSEDFNKLKTYLIKIKLLIHILSYNKRSVYLKSSYIIIDMSIYVEFSL